MLSCSKFPCRRKETISTQWYYYMAEDDILVTTDTAIEHSASFIGTAQLYRSVEHLFPPTLVTCVLSNGLGFSVFGGQSLDCRSFGS